MYYYSIHVLIVTMLWMLRADAAKLSPPKPNTNNHAVTLSIDESTLVTKIAAQELHQKISEFKPRLPQTQITLEPTKLGRFPDFALVPSGHGYMLVTWNGSSYQISIYQLTHDNRHHKLGTLDIRSNNDIQFTLLPDGKSFFALDKNKDYHSIDVYNYNKDATWRKTTTIQADYLAINASATGLLVGKKSKNTVIITQYLYHVQSGTFQAQGKPFTIENPTGSHVALGISPDAHIYACCIHDKVWRLYIVYATGKQATPTLTIEPNNPTTKHIGINNAGNHVILFAGKLIIDQQFYLYEKTMQWLGQPITVFDDTSNNTTDTASIKNNVTTLIFKDNTDKRVNLMQYKMTNAGLEVTSSLLTTQDHRTIDVAIPVGDSCNRIVTIAEDISTKKRFLTAYVMNLDKTWSTPHNLNLTLSTDKPYKCILDQKGTTLAVLYQDSNKVDLYDLPYQYAAPKELKALNLSQRSFIWELDTARRQNSTGIIKLDEAHTKTMLSLPKEIQAWVHRTFSLIKLKQNNKEVLPGATLKKSEASSANTPLSTSDAPSNPLCIIQ